MRVTSLPETQPYEHVLTNGVAAGIRTTQPAADVYETKSDLVIELDVAGFRPNEITVEVAHHHVVVTGTTAGPGEARKDLRHERLGPRFARTLERPHGVDETRLQATYGSGLLVLRAPRVAAAEPRRVSVEAS